MTIKKPADFYSALVILAGIGAIYHQSLSVDTSMIIAMGPLFFPYILMGIITFLAVCLVIKSIEINTSQKGTNTTINREALFLQGVAVVLLLGYLLLLPVISYIPATMAFLAAAMIFLGGTSRKNVITSTIVSCTVTGVLYLIFAKVLRLFLP